MPDQSSLKYKTLYIIWAVLFVLTAALGFITSAEGTAQLLLRLAAAAFFIPPWVIVTKARKEGAYAHTKRIRRLAALWLLAAMVLLCASIASVNLSDTVGNVLYGVMTVACAPLVCGDFYFLPLFLMATLLIGAKSKPLEKIG